MSQKKSKFYLSGLGDGYKWLNYDKAEQEFKLSSSANTSLFQTAFTDKEVEEIIKPKVPNFSAFVRVPFVEKTYFYRLLGKWGTEHVYLNQFVGDGSVVISTSEETTSYKTKFTDDEFISLCNKYQLPMVMFDGIPCE